MRLTTYLLAALASASASHARGPRDARNESTCIEPGAIPAYNASDFVNWGMVLFRSVDMIDVFGTLNPLNFLATSEQQMNLYMIAETLDPLLTEPQTAAMNPFNSSFFPIITPTHTFAEIVESELELDVLLVPGGLGARAPDEMLQPVLDFLKVMFPKVKLFATVCTGSMVAARAGVLDGYMATTNKRAWEQVVATGPNVDWISPARYVVDGKVWSSSGVSLPWGGIIQGSR